MHIRRDILQVLLVLNAIFAAFCRSELVLLHEYPLAKCLDGTPSGYYFTKATNESLSNRFMIILEGGGMCTHFEGCTQRSKTDLGSSRNWKKTFTWNKWSLTTNDTANPFRE